MQEILGGKIVANKNENPINKILANKIPTSEIPTDSPKINVVLLEPRIPQNTGNIGRLCLCANARLHLIHPLGFILDSKEIKRTGMDYFNDVDLVQWDSLEDFLSRHQIAATPNTENTENTENTTNATPTAQERHFLLSTKGQRHYFEADLRGEIFLWFGREDKGLPNALLGAYKEQILTIPMFNNARSLNLANSVSIVVYEALRQRICELEAGF